MFRLRRARDGHYYAKGSYGWSGMITYQLDATAVQLLERLGIQVADMIPNDTMLSLKGAGYAKTGHGGMGTSDHIQRNLANRAHEQAPVLVLAQDDSGWSLQVCLPDLSTEYVAGVQQAPDILSRCSLRIMPVDIEQTAVLLWPGSGGRSVTVPPLAEGYTVRPRGPWPPGWPFASQDHQIAGLDPSGTLFHSGSEASARLSPTEPLVVGDVYCVVGSNLRLPDGLSNRSLGTNSGWDAREFTCLAAGDSEVDIWLASRGHIISGPSPLLMPLTPPRLYTATGTPVYVCGDVCILTLISGEPAQAASDSTLELGVGYRPRGSDASFEPIGRLPFCSADTTWTLHGRKSGVYLVESLSGTTFGLELEFTDEGRTWSDCNPLSVGLSLDQLELRVEAFRGSDSQGTIGASDLVHVERVSVSPECDRVSFEIDIGFGRADRLKKPLFYPDVLDEIALTLNAMVHESAAQPRRIVIDAGAFGQVALDIVPQHSEIQHSGELPKWLVDKAVWIVSVAGMNTGHVVPIPRYLRDSFAAQRGCAALASLAKSNSVPDWMLGQLVELARCLVNAPQERGK